VLKTRSLLFAALALSWVTRLGVAQTAPNDTRNKDQLAALMKEVSAQQIELSANQTKIDEKLAAVAEAIRQARIYSSRAGR